MPTIIDQIRETLAKADGVTEVTMLPLAEAYATEVAAVNDRLATCVSLMNRGLRSEALQQANLRPNVIEWAARLDFPEIEEWLEILQFLGIELPRNLNRDAVQQLQDAMVDEQPLEHLMRQHRRLAIGKAPLNWRLRVLRKLADADPMNVIWQEDLEAWERVRLKQIQNQFETAVKAKEVDECKELSDELRQVKWKIAIPKEFLAKINSATENLLEEQSIRQLADLSEGLNAAYCEQAEERCLELRGQWESIIASIKQAVPSELAEAAEPALLWLAERDRERSELSAHQEALVELERALDDPKSIEHIQRLYHFATRGGFDIDPVLEKRFRVVSAQIQNAVRRKLTLKIAAIVAACVSMLCIFGFWQFNSSKAASIAKNITALRKMVEGNEFQAAEAFIESANAATKSNPEFAELASQFRGLQQKEDSRSQAFNSLLKQIDAENAALIDLQLVNQASQLAISESEKAKVAEIRNRYQVWDVESNKSQFAQLRMELEQLELDLAKLEKMRLEDLQEASIRPLLDKCNELTSKYPRAGETGINLVKSLRQQILGMLEAVRKASETRSAMTLALSQLRNARSIEELKAALQAASNGSLNSPTSQAFTQVLGEERLWNIIGEWNKVAMMAEQLQQSQQEESVEDLITQCRLVSGTIIGILPSQLSQSFVVELERFKKRGTILDQLISDIEGSYIRDLVTVEYSVRVKDKVVRARRYGLSSSLKRDEGIIANANDQRKKGRSQAIELDLIAGPDSEEDKYDVNAPIDVIIQPKASIEDLILELKNQRKDCLNGWDRVLLGVIGRVLTNKDLNNYHKLQISGTILNTGIEGSKEMSENLQGVLQYILAILQKPTSWFQENVDIEDDNQITAELKSKVFDPLAAAYREQTSRKGILDSLAKSKCHWAGVVLRGEAGQFEPALKFPLTTGGRICVVTSNSVNANKAEIVKVGSVSAGRVDFDQTSKDLIEGRPLFFIAD